MERRLQLLYVGSGPPPEVSSPSDIDGEAVDLTVEHAESARTALDRLEAEAVDCVLATFDLPDADGLSFFEAVREVHPELPVLLYPSDEREAVAAGVTGILEARPTAMHPSVLANRVVTTVERHRSDAAAARDRRRFRTLVEGATDVILVVGPDGTISYASPSATRILGRSPSELADVNGFEPIHEDDMPRVRAAFAAIAANPGETGSAEFRYWRPDGECIWAEARGRNVLDDPAIEGIVVYVREITERKRSEAELETSANFRRRVDDITSEPTTTTAEKLDRLLALGCERFALEHGHIAAVDLGRGRHTVLRSVGSSLLEAGTISDLSVAYCRETIERGAPLAIQDVEDRGRSEDAAADPQGIACYIGAELRVEDELLGTICFVDREPRQQPFTEPERAFMDLLARWVSHLCEREEHERAQALDAQRLDVAQRVLRHNLRNELTVIRGWIELHGAETNGVPADETNRCLEAIDDLLETGEKARLVTALDVDASKAPRIIDVHHRLRELVDECAADYPHAEVELDAPGDTIAVGDPERVETAVRNAIENAIEHNPSARPWVCVAAVIGDDALEVSIEDDGPGIPAQEREVLEAGRETPLHHGSGLGLWLIYWCVTTLDGSVSFEERSPTGSRVIVRFPVA